MTETPIREDALLAIRGHVADLAVPPPWKWSHWRDALVLHAGRPAYHPIMRFMRRGLLGGQPQWRDHATGETLSHEEWCKREGTYNYIHPDGLYLVSAANAVPGLLAEIDRLRARVAELEDRESDRRWENER